MRTLAILLVAALAAAPAPLLAQYKMDGVAKKAAAKKDAAKKKPAAKPSKAAKDEAEKKTGETRPGAKSK